MEDAKIFQHFQETRNSNSRTFQGPTLFSWTFKALNLKKNSKTQECKETWYNYYYCCPATNLNDVVHQLH